MFSKKTHIYHCDVTFDLLDPGNAVYHPNYLVLCDRARADALGQSGVPVHKLWKEGIAFVVRQNTSEYFKPAQFGHSLTIISTLEGASKTSLHLRQRVFFTDSIDGKNLPCPFMDHFPTTVDLKHMIHQLQIHLVCINLNLFKPVRIPNEVIDALQLSESQA